MVVSDGVHTLFHFNILIHFNIVHKPFFGRTVEPRISRVCDRSFIYFYV